MCATVEIGNGGKWTVMTERVQVSSNIMANKCGAGSELHS